MQSRAERTIGEAHDKLDREGSLNIGICQQVQHSVGGILTLFVAWNGRFHAQGRVSLGLHVVDPAIEEGDQLGLELRVRRLPILPRDWVSVGIFSKLRAVLLNFVPIGV